MVSMSVPNFNLHKVQMLLSLKHKKCLEYICHNLSFYGIGIIFSDQIFNAESKGFVRYSYKYIFNCTMMIVFSWAHVV